jgi:hypothetical protein
MGATLETPKEVETARSEAAAMGKGSATLKAVVTDRGEAETMESALETLNAEAWAPTKELRWAGALHRLTRWAGASLRVLRQRSSRSPSHERYE